MVALLTLGLPRPAWAADADQDGYQPPFDCDDGAAAVSPNGQEDDDGVDNDCDGLVDVTRRLIGIPFFPAGPWVDTGAVARPTSDLLRVGYAASQAAGSSYRDFGVTSPRGRIHAAIEVTALTGTGCTAAFTTGRAGSADITATVALTSTGTIQSGALAVHAPNAAAPRVLKRVKLACTAGSQATVDWIALSNVPDIVPPLGEVTWWWKDTEMPGGGLSPTVVRSGEDRDADGYEEVYAASDLGGVAHWDVDAWDWVTINGEGATGLTTEADLGVWDVLPTVDGLFALTGRTFTDEVAWNHLALAGALWFSPDDGGTWERLATTRTVIPNSSDEEYGVGGWGRYGGCLGADWAPTRSVAGGSLLQAEPDASLVYIANGDEDELGVALWDAATSSACELPNVGTPLPQADFGWSSSTSAATRAGAGYVRALARMYADDGTPVLLVGYSGRVDGAPALYVCALPDGDDDGVVDGLGCGSGSVTCSEVDTSLVTRAIDVRDIEVRQELDYSNQALVASGGDYTWLDGSTPTCGEDGDGIFVVEVSGVGGVVSAEIIGEVYTGFQDDWDSTIGSDLTGIALDTDLTIADEVVDRYLYAFTPVTSDKTYEPDRIHRLDLSGALDGCDGTSADPDCDDYTNGYDDDGDSTTDEDGGASPWIAINGSDTDGDADGYADDEVDRSDSIANAGDATTWLHAATVAHPDRHPGRWAPGQSIDGIFIPFFPALEDEAEGGRDLAMLGSMYNLWGVFDMDRPTSLGFDPELDTTWYVGPVASWSNYRTFQELVVKDIAQDSHGNLWVPVMDLGLLMQPDLDSDPDTKSHEPMERDCLWDSINAGGASVSIAPTTTGGDAVWVAFYDQDDTNAVPHDLGIWRTLDYGASWAYQAAGVPQSDVRDDYDPSTYTCKEEPQPCLYCAPALDPTAEHPGRVFSDGQESVSAASWGNPTYVSALDEKVAVAMFKSYTVGSVSGAGGLALTLDGGATWTQVPFDEPTCDAEAFFARPKGATIWRKSVPSTNWPSWEFDADADGLEDGEWQVTVLVASQYAADSACALALVTLDGDATNLHRSWTWYSLDGSGSCLVDGDNLLGATPSPWSDEAFVWGRYTHTRSGTEHTGGACVVDLTAGTLTSLIDPATHRYNIADVAPDPGMADVVAAAPQLDASAWFECMELNPAGTAAVGCPDVPEPLVLDRLSGTWQEFSVHAELPPNLVGTSIAWGESPLRLYYGTEGSGAWRTDATW